MPFPLLAGLALPALEKATGGASGPAGPSQSGNIGSSGGLSGGTGGIAPVVIGGFKSDGSAAAGNIPNWLIVGVLAIGAFYVLRKR